jgi:hypothetical protein
MFRFPLGQDAEAQEAKLMHWQPQLAGCTRQWKDHCLVHRALHYALQTLLDQQLVFAIAEEC